MHTNPHLQQSPAVHGSPWNSADLVVYAVHGRGQDADYMAALADRIGVPGISYVFPRAANHSWYPHGFMEPKAKNQPNLNEALAAVQEHLELLEDLGIPARRTVLLGFSQGACLLSEYILQSQKSFAAAVLLTGGYLGPDDDAWADKGTGLERMQVYMATAAEDAWVPAHRVEATAAALKRHGAQVEVRIFDEPEHHVNDDSVQRIADLLRRLQLDNSGTHSALGEIPDATVGGGSGRLSERTSQ
jgi:phospholipase/carboxylesterase